MANTYTALYYHIVFSTKNRTPFITPDVEERLWPYVGGIIRENDMSALCIGGMPDHPHILQTTPKTISVSQAVQLIKGGSSKWVHEAIPCLRGFAWQHGYGAFTVGQEVLDIVAHYIRSQREHHSRRTFEDEYRDLLLKNGVQFDERFLWG